MDEIPKRLAGVTRLFGPALQGVSELFPKIIAFYIRMLHFKSSSNVLSLKARLLAFGSGLLIMIAGAPMIGNTIYPTYIYSILNFLTYDSLYAYFFYLIIAAFCLCLGINVEKEGTFSDHLVRGIFFIPINVVLLFIVVGVMFALASLVSTVFSLVGIIKGGAK